MPGVLYPKSIKEDGLLWTVFPASHHRHEPQPVTMSRSDEAAVVKRAKDPMMIFHFERMNSRKFFSFL